MTRIGGQCKGCSRAYWKSKNRKEATELDASSAAEGESLPEISSPDAGSAEPDINTTEASVFGDPAQALKGAVHRLAEIEAKLGTPTLSTAGVATVISSPLVDEHSPGSQASHDAWRKEQQMLKARVNAIFRCIGLWESHEKVLREAGGSRWQWHHRLEEALRGSYYFRSLPYFQLLLMLRYKLPGIADLLRFMDEIYSKRVSSLITIYEISSSTDVNLVRHEFKTNDPTQLLSHWDILHNFIPDDETIRSVLLVNGLDSAAVEVLGHALEIHPLVFARHLWRNFGREMDNLKWEGPPMSQAPLCSLPDQPAQKIALDVEAYTSLKSLSGIDLHGLEDLRSIETVGELLGIRERKLWGREAVFEKRKMAQTLKSLRDQCSLMNWLERYGFAESTRLEQPLARCVDEGYSRGNTTILSALELCASATICTLPSRTQQLSSKTLVVRTPSGWHKSRSIHTEGAQTWNDPFRIETPMQFGGTESRNSIYDALWTVRNLEAAVKTCLTQTEVSTLVSLSLLKAAFSTVWDMTVSDHNMLVNPGNSFTLERNSNELVEVSDGCSAYLNQRCQRRRSAMLLLSAVAGKIQLAVTDSTSAALSRYVARESKYLQEAKTKIESQLQRTEALLTVRIDQSFRDLQIELAQTQLEESRKAIKQADTVARLTILAFIFIPVGAVCGFFGMNIVEVAADGGFSFWVFGTTMGAVLAMTLLLAFGDSIYALWNYYARKVDFEMSGRRLFPLWFLTKQIPYPFRWVSLKIRAKMKYGQAWRQRMAMQTKKEIELRAEV